MTKSDTLILDAPKTPTTVGVSPEQFDGAVMRFLASKTERTRATYGRALTLYRQCAVDYGLDPLGRDAIIAFNALQQRDFKNEIISGETVRTRLRALTSFFGWCWRQDLTNIKPELVRKDLVTIPPSKQLSPRSILTVGEARELLDAAPDNRTYLLLRLLLDAGLRISEALSLRCDDIYSADDRYFIHVRWGKGQKQRDVEIDQDLYQVIADYIAGELGLDPLKDKTPIFGNLHRSTAFRWVTRAASDAGIDKNISPHSLRHTHGNQLAQMGWAIELIGERLGHSSIDITKRYTRPAELLKQKTIPRMPWMEIS